jgi:hypothetical protein
MATGPGCLIVQPGGKIDAGRHIIRRNAPRILRHFEAFWVGFRAGIAGRIELAPDLLVDYVGTLEFADVFVIHQRRFSLADLSHLGFIKIHVSHHRRIGFERI